jgi:hypothetical protein
MAYMNDSIQVHKEQDPPGRATGCCPVIHEKGRQTSSIRRERVFPSPVPIHTPYTITSPIRLLLQHLIHCNTPLAQIRLGQFDLFEKLLVRFGLVLESVDAVSEFAQEVGAE